MKSKYNNLAALFPMLLLMFAGCVTAEELTGVTGQITGSPPVIYNKSNQAERINIMRENNPIEDNEELDINDSIALSWEIFDTEGDNDSSKSTVEWVCTEVNGNQHVLATATDKYVIMPEDKACVIGINITPKTETGSPQENNRIEIHDVSNYDDTDNIPSGPVNPHDLNITHLYIAPDNPAARLDVAPTTRLNTAFAGAQIQLETDNLADQLDWSSSNNAIATVSDNGLVTIKSKGPFRIMARHNEQRASIIINPKLFFVFSQKSMNWYDAKDWCESQGYRLPEIGELSIGENIRQAPSDSLWQEWGSSLDDVPHAGVVFWSSHLMMEDIDAYSYMYTKNGSVTSNTSDKSEGVACVVP